MFLIAYNLEAVRSLSQSPTTHTHARACIDTHIHTQFVDRAMLLTAYQGRNSRVLGHLKCITDIALRELTLLQPNRTRVGFTVKPTEKVFQHKRFFISA